MNYIYDIVLNFNKEYYSFYEWNRKDNIINVKKIPLFLVDNECFNIMKYDNVCVSKDFINVIRDKTYTYTRSKLGPSLLISNEKEVIAIMFNENGNLIRTVALRKGDSKLGDSDNAFENTYIANKLSIKKMVAGNLGDKSKYFDFTVTLTGENGKTYTLPATITGGSAGSEKAESVTISGTTKFTLKHNDTITIENLPKGVEYEVKEDSSSSAGYEVSATGDNGTMGEEAQTAVFTNTKKGDIDTGVYLDNLPYILVFAGVLAIAAVFVVRRRRFED